jgi:outer membrane cobalamin receptor
MKAKCILAGVCVLACVGLGSAWAGETAAPAAKDQASVKPRNGEVVLTGSYLKSKVRRYGRITNTANLLIVIDRKDIERSGAGDLSQLLRRYGLNR